MKAPAMKEVCSSTAGCTYCGWYDGVGGCGRRGRPWQQRRPGISVRTLHPEQRAAGGLLSSHARKVSGAGASAAASARDQTCTWRCTEWRELAPTLAAAAICSEPFVSMATVVDRTPTPRTASGPRARGWRRGATRSGSPSAPGSSLKLLHQLVCQRVTVLRVFKETKSMFSFRRKDFCIVTFTFLSLYIASQSPM